MTGERPTTATIDLAALRANAGFARALAGRREVIAVVKADAYGHGLVPSARALLEAGCRRLAVVTVSEAAELRAAAVGSPILVLGGVHDLREAERAVSLHTTPVLHGDQMLALATSAARGARTRLRVHVEVDTGMRRMGVSTAEAPAFLARVVASDALDLEGAFTHLARADEPDLADALAQLARFRALLRELQELGIRPPLIHADNSAALLSGKAISEALPEATAVRPGLMLYGACPAPHLDPGGRLRPAMTLRSRVVQVRTVEAGEGVGYGATFRARRPTRIATLPVGYADGVPRSLGNKGDVWLGGALRPIVGRVSMDYITVDVQDGPVDPGDEAVLFGVGMDGGLPVEQVAEAGGTISYELLVRVGTRVPREMIG